MESRGNLMRKALVVQLVAFVAAGLFALSGSAAAQHPVAQASKKCKRKHHGKKHRCKRHAPAPAMISISPASQDFGVPQIGGETRTFTVTDIGGSTTGVPIPMLTQSGTDFSIVGNGCVTPLSAGASCPIDVHVATSGAGHVSAMLNVTAIPGGRISASVTANIEA